MDFSKNQFEKKIFSNVISLIYGKIHVHHFHVTGEIIGYYAHDFCNQKIREINFSLFLHNLSGIDFVFIVKGIRLSVWRTKTIKCYLQYLEKLAETVTEDEKNKIIKEC